MEIDSWIGNLFERGRQLERTPKVESSSHEGRNHYERRENIYLDEKALWRQTTVAEKSCCFSCGYMCSKVRGFFL